MEEKIYDVAIVGGGIVGAATMYRLQERFPELSILILEKENELAPHQTGHNSGVIHSGLYYKPGSKKAINCVKGRRALVKFAAEHNVPHEVCGKVVVATDEAELPYLDKIFQNGLANDTEGIEKISGEQVKEIEPYCKGIAGIRVPCTGIIDFVAATKKMVELVLAMNPKSELRLGESFEKALHFSGHSEILTDKGSVKARHLIFCGGLQSDRLAKLDGVRAPMQIVGFRGDYYELEEHAKQKVKHLIYPVPNPAFPFLGVHFTRMTNGEIECGPNAVFTFKREGYGKTDFDLRDSMDALGYVGTWKLFAKHWRFGLDEYKRAFSKKLFLDRLQRLIPSLKMSDIRPGRAGVRAMALGPDGEMIDDFEIAYRENSIHVLNAPSPAATACLAIGEDIVKMATEKFGLGS
jgi:L-2-hydroxyglutarate oxidase